MTDRDPSEYFRTLERSFPGAIASQWIPMDEALWSVDKYREFLAARRQLLADAKNWVLDNLWNGKQTTELTRRTPEAVTQN